MQVQQGTASVEPSPLLVRLIGGDPYTKWIPMLISAAAFLLSLVVFWTNSKERVRARQLSVLDDYWFRRVLTPICVEPLVNFILNCTTKLSELGATDFSHDQVKKRAYDGFLQAHKREKRELVLKLRLLDLVERSLSVTVSEQLDALEDLVTRHCAVRSLPVPQAPPDASTADIISAALEVYRKVGQGIGAALSNLSTAGRLNVEESQGRDAASRVP